MTTNITVSFARTTFFSRLYKKLVDENGYFDKNRNQQQLQWMYNNINEELKQLFYGSKNITEHLSVLEKDIISSNISPVKAAQKIIEEFKRSFKNPAWQSRQRIHCPPIRK